MKARRAIGLGTWCGAVSVIVAVAGVPKSALPARDRCMANALRVVAGHARAVMRCQAAGARRGRVADAGCVVRSGEQFALQLRRVGAQGGCVGTPAPFEALVTVFADRVAARVSVDVAANGRHCAAAVRGTVGRLATGLFSCALRAVAAGGTRDPSCAGMAEDRFVASVGRVLDRGGCAADLVGLAVATEQLVADSVGALQDGTVTTTTTVSQATTTSSTLPPAVSLRTHVLPIFTARCTTIGCHAGVYAASGLDLSTAAAAYAQLVGVASVEKPGLQRVRSRAPATSYLLDKIRNAAGIVGAPMPTTGAALTSDEVQTITDWIAQGATNN